MNQASTLPRLLHIIPFATLGGTEKDCLYFIEASFHGYKHKIWVLGSEGPMVKQWTSAGAEVYVWDILRLSHGEMVERLAKLSLSEDYDGILYWSTIKLPMIRYAMRNQHCRMAVHVGNPANFRLPVILKQMVEHVFYSSPIETRLFACSNHVLRTLKIHPYYRQFPARVSYNPVRLLDYNPYQLKNIDDTSEVIIGMTARLDPIKDHKTLLLAFKNVLNYYPSACLWLIGDGMLREELEHLSVKLGISQRVIFWGNVVDVYEKLQQMDIFVYSTTAREGLGNALSEAMACGLPCVVSDLPMMHELVGDNSSTLFFQPANVDDMTQKILQLLSDIQVRASLSDMAYHRAISTFNAERYVNERLQFLLDLKMEDNG